MSFKINKKINYISNKVDEKIYKSVDFKTYMSVDSDTIVRAHRIVFRTLDFNVAREVRTVLFPLDNIT